MVSEDDVPTGNLQLAERTYLLLRRDYFYTGSTRPTGGNPLLLNVSGYIAISVIALAYLGWFYEWLGFGVPHLQDLALASLGLFFLCFGVHLVLWTASLLWRAGLRGYRAVRT